MKLATIVLAGLSAALSLPAQFPDFTPPTPLIDAAMRNDTAEVKRLLAAGANPNEGRFLGATPIFFTLLHHNVEAAEAMIAKGADVKATDGSGSTTLMWAAYDEVPDTRLVELFLKQGIDPNAKNKKGETALTWALRRGYTPIVETLKQAGASDTAQVRQSLEKAIALLQKSGPEFFKVSGCSSCHNQSLPQMAYSIARQRGLRVDEAVAEHQVKAVIATFKPAQEAMASGKASLPDPPISVTWSLLGLAAEGYKPDATTAAMTHIVAICQSPDGSFPALPSRPPIESSTFTATALSLRAMQIYGTDSDAGSRIERARQWLETARPRTTEDRVMQLLGLHWAGAASEHLRAAAAGLLAEQRHDGGWSQLPSIETDAYATGQALVALHWSGQLDTTAPAYQRGVAYLLRTQFDDGSWLVRTRSNPFQQYKESGFPHGRHQWISAAGTSWAAMALGLTQPVAGEQISKVIAAE
jgi:hypothetical protein